MIYHIGNIEVDTSNFHLSENGNAVAVEPKVFDLIAYMIKNRERLVTRQELFDEIWSGRIVSDTSLSNHIKSARKVLGDDGHKQQVIKTIHGRGYQFIADIEELYEQQEEANLAAAPSLLTEKKQESLSLITKRAVFSVFFFVLLMVGIAWWFTLEQNNALKSPDIAQGANTNKSIAVLAFSDLSPEKDQEYFSDGLSDELINLLINIPNLRVISRSSAFAFKGKSLGIPEIADRLNVSHILEGSVRSSSDQLRVTAKLIEARSDTILWSRAFDRKLADIFAIQGEISTAVVEALRGHLEGKLPIMKVKTTDIEAYNAYLKGRQLVDSEIKSKIYASLAEFDQAIQIAPNYAPAHSGKAEAYIQLSEYAYGDLPSEQAYTLAKPSLEKALSLDPDLADAHVVKGRIFTREGKYDEALMAFNQAIKIAPNHARAYFWRGTLQQAHGYRAKKMQDYEVSYRLNPLFTPVSHHLYHDYISENQLDKAYEILRRMREEYADQTDIGSQMKLAHYEVAWLLVNGDWSDAYQLAIKFVEESDNFLIADLGYILFFLKNEEAFYHYYNNKFFPINEFFVSYFFNNKEHADKALESLRNSSSSKKKEFLPIANALRLDMNNDDTSVIAANRLIKDVDESVDGILFKTYPPYTYASYIVAARLRAGDEAGVKRLTEQFRKFVEKYERNGYDCCIKYQQAYLKVLEQDYEGAMDLLEETFKNNSLYWHHIEHPILSPIHNNERYKSLVKVYSEFLNAERQKLGWAPVVIGYNQDVINN